MRKIIVLSLFWCIAIVVSAMPDAPKQFHLVNDFADVFTPNEEQQIEKVVFELYNNTSTQIAVVTVKELDGMDISSYAFELGEKWGIGDKKFNNGIVVLLKPKSPASGRGEVFIATGYGLEGAVPDIVCKRIVDSEMVPLFKQGSYFGGVLTGVTRLVDLTKGEYSAKQYLASTKTSKKSKSWGLLPIIIIFIVFRMLFSRRSVGVGKALPWWFLFSALGSSSSHRGSWNDFSSSSGGFGGGFGGGGFGGGSFGGGGAGGSW